LTEAEAAGPADDDSFNVPHTDYGGSTMFRPSLPDDQHQAQVKSARNQSLFREVNERVEQLQRGWAPVSEIDFICECADDTWTEPISMTIVGYEERPERFFVFPEHVCPEVEVVVARNDRFWIVEKIAIAARVAAALNPRSTAAA
jgi:hypothetical protein